MGRVLIKNLTRRPAPRFAYTKIQATVLPRWDVSLAFVPPGKARALNHALRGKNYVPNVLSYAVGDKSGEVVICLSEAERQAESYGMDERSFVVYLFIHGLLHLKGHPHGATMERREREFLAKFANTPARTLLPHGTTHRNRNRHRNLPGQTGRRRGIR